MLARTPNREFSSAVTLVRPRNPNFAIVYAEVSDVPVTESIEPRFTIEPPPAARITGKTARVQELINSFRVRGHLMADIDPLEYKQRTHPDLERPFRVKRVEIVAPLGILSALALMLTLPADTTVRTGHGDSTSIGAELPNLEEWIVRGH